MKDNFDDNVSSNENVQADATSATEEKNNIGADIIRGHINTIILRALYERDKYGYEIMNDIEQKSHNQYSLKQPTLYSALKRLENQGYIIAYWKTDEVSSGGRRKYFTLTDSGREITEKNLAEWEYSRTIIDSLISDRSFDFSQPAPTPVDFTILRDSVSRVPTKRGDDNSDGDEDKEDKDASPSQSSKSETNSVAYKTVVNESEQFVEHTTTNEESSFLYQMLAEQSSTPSAQDETAGKTVNSEESAKQDERAEIYSRMISEAPAGGTDSVAESYGAAGENTSYREISNDTQYARTVQTEQAANDEEEIQAQIRQHENYIRLISSRTKEPKSEDVVPNSENISADKLLYNAKPSTERDYKNLINGIYDKTITYGSVETNYGNSSSRQSAAKRKNSSSSQLVDRGRADGVRVKPSYEYETRNNYATKTTYNKGLTFLICSGIVLFIMLIEFIFCMIFKDSLHVSVAYPVIILLLGIVQFAVFGGLYFKGYGANCTKPMTNTYLSKCIIFAIILILIICVSSFLFNINFTLASDIMKLIVIPSITALNIVVFAIAFRLLTK